MTADNPPTAEATVDVAGTGTASPRYAHVRATADLPAVLAALGVARGRPVLVSVGGARGMSPERLDQIAGLLPDHVIGALVRCGAAVVDGGTDSGVTRVMGTARRVARAGFPPVGVAAEGTVVVPDSPAGSRGTSELDPGHTHVVPGPGISWGDGSPWLSDVAAAIADGGPSLTLVVNGGTVTYDDLARSLERGRPVLVVAGTGRAADSIAAAARGDDPDPGASRAAASPLVRVVAPADGAGMAGAVADVLGGTVPRAPDGRP